jgi:hypothetical protein
LDESDELFVNMCEEMRNEDSDTLGNISLEKLLRNTDVLNYQYRGYQENEAFIKAILDAWHTSSIQTRWGNKYHALMGILVGRNKRFSDVRNTRSGDIEFIDNNPSIFPHYKHEKSRSIYLVQLKSGHNWGNADQRKQLSANFSSWRKSKSIDYKNYSIITVEAYSYSSECDTENHSWRLGAKYFWWFISGEENFYERIWDNNYISKIDCYEQSALKRTAGRLEVEMNKKGFVTRNKVNYSKLRDWLHGESVGRACHVAIEVL